MKREQSKIDIPEDCELCFKFVNGLPVDLSFPYDYIVIPHTASDGQEIFLVVGLTAMIKSHSQVLGCYVSKDSAIKYSEYLKKRISTTIQSEVKKYDCK